MNYADSLTQAGISLLEPLQQVKKHHYCKCNSCGHEFLATPLSITQIYKKWGTNGCKQCNLRRQSELKHTIRQANIQKLMDRGLEILSDWDGTTGEGRDSTPIDVTVKNTQCGHTFTSTSKNLLTRGVECPICAKQYRTNILNADSERRSANWRQTASDWQIYKSEVTKLTRINYNTNKHSINPDNLPTGRAGTEGAYHVDHIIPIRYCFNNKIPVHICADKSNLQMLGWRENVGSRDRLKEGVKIPNVLKPYIHN